jgi:hypothetical protein
MSKTCSLVSLARIKIVSDPYHGLRTIAANSAGGTGWV